GSMAPNWRHTPIRHSYAPNARILGWLGTTRMPIVLIPFWVFTEVKRVVGAQRFKYVNAPVRGDDGPMTRWEVTPVPRPALSPLVIGVIVNKLCTGAKQCRMLKHTGTAGGPNAMSGYGTGISAGGVRQTSGNPKSTPIIWVFVNIFHAP